MFKKTLKNIRVVDFSRLLPGPYASTLLQKMGAQVTCITPPQEDPVLSAYSPFVWVEEGKKFVSIDLKKASFKAHKFIQKADVLIEGFRPGAMDRLGLSFKEVKKLNPNILYVSISGYDVKKGKGDQGGHDMNFLIESGLYDLIYPEEFGKSAIIPKIQIADIAAGQLAFQLIMNRLFVPRKQRQAEHIQTSIQEGAEFFGEYLKEDTRLIKMMFDHFPRYQIFWTKDKKRLAFAGIEEKFFQGFILALEIKNLPQDHVKILKVFEKKIKSQNLSFWKRKFKNLDLCVSYLD